MASMFQAYVDSQAAAREDFGRMLRLWRERNGWTQYTAERWGREAGFRTVSSGNISMVEQGKAGDLRAQAHFQLGDVNRRIAEKDWGPLKSQEIRQALAEVTADLRRRRPGVGTNRVLELLRRTAASTGGLPAPGQRADAGGEW